MAVVRVDLNFAPRLERVTVVTPLGIRFWDAARDVQVDDGLEVTARPEGRPDSTPVRAFKTASGAFAFQGLPGLEDFEHPPESVGEPEWPNPADAKHFVIRVHDRLGRFLPVTFTAPAPHRGLLLTPGLVSPPATPVPGFFLFSSPSRPPVPGTAAVRADLIDADTGAPAAFAVLEVQVPGRGLAVGLSDERGCVAVLFPYPEFRKRLNASPPGPLPPDQQSWPLTVRVRYASPALRSPPSRLRPGEWPDLRTIFSQPRAQFLPQGGPGVDDLTADLTFGRELSLQGADEGGLLVRGAPP